MNELDQVILNSDFPQYGLERGDPGTIVLVHGQGDGYEVEFVRLGGDTVAVTSLTASQVRSVAAQEIAHARELVSFP